ncbi:hypothetical protein KKB83_02710 [Patescibacteria group bacterium]|nr:hypothetical protein [Patescibacteria group bacterium]
MTERTNPIFTLLMVVMNWLLILLLVTVFFLLGSFLTIIVSRMLFDVTSEGGLVIAGYALVGGSIAAFFSLLPSYKLSLHLAKFVEKKWGVKIDNPKKLFWLSILIPVALLFLLGIVL